MVLFKKSSKESYIRYIEGVPKQHITNKMHRSRRKRLNRGHAGEYWWSCYKLRRRTQRKTKARKQFKKLSHRNKVMKEWLQDALY